MKRRITLSNIMLLISNLIVILTILYYQEGILVLLIVYWIESVWIGLLNIVKLWMIKSWIVSRIFATLFFLMHFGIAMAIYIVFVFVIGDVLEPELSAEIKQDPILFLWNNSSLLIALASVTTYHIISLIKNYIMLKEYIGVRLSAQMFKPYNRIFVMHFTVMAGVFLLTFLKFSTTIFVMSAIACIKALLDVWAHNNARKEAEKAAVRNYRP